MRIWTDQELASARRTYGVEADGTPSTQEQYTQRVRALGVEAPSAAAYVPWAHTWDRLCAEQEGGRYDDLRAIRHAFQILAVVAAARNDRRALIPPVHLAGEARRYGLQFRRVATGLQRALETAPADSWARVLKLGHLARSAYTPQEIADTSLKTEGTLRAMAEEIVQLAYGAASDSPVVPRTAVILPPVRHPTDPVASGPQKPSRLRRVLDWFAGKHDCEQSHT